MSNPTVTVKGVTYAKCDCCSIGWDRQPTPTQAGELLDALHERDERIAGLEAHQIAQLKALTSEDTPLTGIVEKLEADNARLRESLQYYATGDAWDGGDIARDVLGINMSQRKRRKVLDA